MTRITSLQRFVRCGSIKFIRANLNERASQLPKPLTQTQGKLCSEHNKTNRGRCWAQEKLQSCYFFAIQSLLPPLYTVHHHMLFQVAIHTVILEIFVSDYFSYCS